MIFKMPFTKELTWKSLSMNFIAKINVGPSAPASRLIFLKILILLCSMPNIFEVHQFWVKSNVHSATNVPFIMARDCELGTQQAAQQFFKYF